MIWFSQPYCINTSILWISHSYVVIPSLINHLDISWSLTTSATSVHFHLRHTVTIFAWRARASYVTTVRGVDGHACPKQTSSIQAKNSLYPVSVGCGTRLMTSFVLFWWGGKLTFSTEPFAVCLQRFHSCFCHFISGASMRAYV